jgi:hypothetical protein
MVIVAAIDLPLGVEGDRQVDRLAIGDHGHVQRPAALLFLDGGAVSSVACSAPSKFGGR